MSHAIYGKELVSMWFTVHKPNEVSGDRFNMVEHKAREFADMFVGVSDQTEEQAFALRKLREASQAMQGAFMAEENKQYRVEKEPS